MIDIRVIFRIKTQPSHFTGCCGGTIWPSCGGIHEISKWKANWIGNILGRNCLLQRVIEGKTEGGREVTGRWGRRRRKLLDDLKERRGYSHLKEEALDRTMWRACFGRGFGPVVRQTTKWMMNAGDLILLDLCEVTETFNN